MASIILHVKNGTQHIKNTPISGNAASHRWDDNNGGGRDDDDGMLMMMMIIAMFK